MHKDRIIIFGAGGSGKKLFESYKAKDNIEIVAFADNFKTGDLFDVPIIKSEEIKNFDYDYIIIASVAAAPIKNQLLALGIPEQKISKSYVEISSVARDIFIKRFGEEARRKRLNGNVAEAGVFQGDFAALINKYFPDKKLYLFDTFTGFDARDIALEEDYEKDPHRGDHFNQTSIDLVLSKMTNPENCIVKQGYVPDTFKEIEDKFCFVNLDMDLYQPTLRALEWFWPRIVKGGVILIHDYFDETETYPNLKKAVINFTGKENIPTVPIGDDLSIALVKS